MLDPAALLPLKPAETLILMMLAAGDRHGYGIRQDVLDHTSGRIELEAGTLYRHIRKLVGQDLIVAAPGESRDRDAEADERRIYYRLTPFGRRVLSAEALRMRELVKLAESRRLIAPARS